MLKISITKEKVKVTNGSEALLVTNNNTRLFEALQRSRRSGS